MVSLRVLGWLFLILPVLVYSVVGVYRYQQIRVEAEVRLDRALRVAREHALKVLDTSELTLLHLLDTLGNADDAAIRLREKGLHDKMVAMVNDKPQMDSIWVQGVDGRPLLSSRF